MLEIIQVVERFGISMKYGQCTLQTILSILLIEKYFELVQHLIVRGVNARVRVYGMINELEILSCVVSAPRE